MPAIAKVIAQHKVTIGPVQLRFALGDADGNGTADVSFGVRVINVFEIPPLVVNLDADLAQKAFDAGKAFGELLSKGKPKRA